MKPFMDEDFLLSTKTAKLLYHDYAKKLPIIDYHCHINPKEIAEDITFDTITKVWLSGDHYKWRLMRANGVLEEYITGNGSDRDKFKQWAKTLKKAIGNPLYHWSHLELQRYFDCYEIVTEENADKIFDLCNEKLRNKDMSARGFIKQSNVKVICTTDDPIDSLEWHKKIAEDTFFDVKVLPAFRPDKAMNLEKPDYLEYISKLGMVSGISITSFALLKDALINRMEYFNSMGCKISDHGLSYVMYQPVEDEQIEKIFTKRINGDSITELEELQFKTAFLVFVGKEYYRLSWVMQLHYGTKRDNNTMLYKKVGPDTGFDCINTEGSSAALSNFLNALNITDELPKTIIYSLNPNDNAAIETIIGCFQDSSALSKIQHGSAWWFNDSKSGITEQMNSLANLGLLANFIGMLTDSRSFLSYTRHEYSRRILCNMLGTFVENGEYPNDTLFLGQMAQNISYYNASNYFGF